MDGGRTSPAEQTPQMSWASGCVGEQHLSWLNGSEETGEIWRADSPLFDAYVCEYRQLERLRLQLRLADKAAQLCLGALGAVGGLFSVLTLSRRRFPTSDFLLFRVIGCLELLQMLVITSMAALGFWKCFDSYICAVYWAHVSITVSNVCADGVDLLVLFLSVERAVACLLPLYFRNIHSPGCYRLAILLALLVPSVFSAFQALELQVVYDPRRGAFDYPPSEFSKTQLFECAMQANTVRFYLTASLIALATAFSTFGLWTTARRKQMLLRRHSCEQRKSLQAPDEHAVVASAAGADADADANADANANAKTANDNGEQWKLHRCAAKTEAVKRSRRRQIDLCCLQLCLAIPVIVNHTLYATALRYKNEFLIGRDALAARLDFERAMEELRRARTVDWLYLATNVTNVMSHALHLYLYLLFSPNVRRGFLELLADLFRLNVRRFVTEVTH